STPFPYTTLFRSRAPGDGEQQNQAAHEPCDVATRDVRLPSPDAGRPRALGGFDGHATSADQEHDQHGGAGHQPRPPPRARHGRMPWAASQPSTSARYVASADSLPASKRMTRTG